MTEEEKAINENSLTRVLIDRCKELGIKDLYHLKDLLELAEENAKLKKHIKEVENDSTNCEIWSYETINKLKAQIEKMKNFYNCAHSNRALCPNKHNCKGCKDWELAE